MNTKLIEFVSERGNMLRAVLVGQSKNVVVMLHGFERAASTEPKFKHLSDMLEQKGIASFRLDFAGCGLSDGNFQENSMSAYVKDTHSALSYLRDSGYHPHAVVAHSLASCIVASLDAKDQEEFKRVVLIAPALNQKDLLRYWFVKNTMKKKDPLFQVSWKSYPELLNEAEFLADCERGDRMSRANFVGAEYYLENMKRDFSGEISSLLPRTLLVQGSDDGAVPLESLRVYFPNQIIVKHGDHDLERPDLIQQWLPGVTEFLSQ